MSYNPNNPNGQASPANSAPVVLDTTDSGYLSSISSAIASVLANQTNGTQETQVTNFPSVQPVSQSGSWSVGRTWTLSSGSDSISAAQGGVWNITNITGTVSLPTGAATAANQATANTSLASILANQTNGTQETQVTNFPSVQAVSQSGTWNINNVSGTVSLPTGASTSALQTSGNTTLSSILTTLTNGTQETQVTNFPSVQAVSQSGTWTVQQGSPPWAMNLSQVGGAAVALGQAPAATSIPVVTQSDSAPATQAITAQDTTSVTTTGANNQSLISGSPSAGSAASFALASFATVHVLVTGIWTGTLVSEVSMDGGNTWLTHGVKQTGASYIASSFTANFEAAGSASGYTNYRIRSTAAWTGTATVKISLSINPYIQIITSPLTLRDSTTQSIANTIKAASTAAAAGDTSLVVGLSPNSPLPAGTNAIGAVTQSGAWTTGRTWNLSSGADSVSAAQGTAAALSGKWPVQITDGTNTMPTMDVAARAGFQKITDGTNTAAVKAGSAAAAAADPSLVVALSPNSPLPTGSNTIGATASESATGSAIPAKASMVGGSDGTNLRAFSTDTSGNLFVVGNDASGVADSGNPVKVAAKYNSTLPSFSTGNRTDLQSNQFGELAIVSRNKYLNIAGAVASTVVKSGAGRLHTVIVNDQGGGQSFTIYDNTAASGTVIATVTNTGTGPVTLIFDCEFSTGLTIATVGASNNITVTYQ